MLTFSNLVHVRPCGSFVYQFIWFPFDSSLRVIVVFLQLWLWCYRTVAYWKMYAKTKKKNNKFLRPLNIQYFLLVKPHDIWKSHHRQICDRSCSYKTVQIHPNLMLPLLPCDWLVPISVGNMWRRGSRILSNDRFRWTLSLKCPNSSYPEFVLPWSISEDVLDYVHLGVAIL